MLFCLLLDDGIVCRICMVRQETWSYSTCLVNAQSIMHITLQLYDVLRFDSTVVNYVIINMLSPKLNKQIFQNFEA